MSLPFDTDLSGKTAIVTGSTKGIGYATALGLAKMGARVAVNGRTEDAVRDAMDRIQSEIPDADLVEAAADLSTADGCRALIEALPSADILVNNMGIYHHSDDFFGTGDDDWQEMFDVNVMSGVRLSRHYLKQMLDADWGRIVFVSSESGVFIPPEMIHYGFSKAAQLAVARGLAELTKGSNVTVNSVLPGPTEVDQTIPNLTARAESRGISLDEMVQHTFDVRRPSSLIQRYATPDEVASLICYVCSPAAAATNGAGLRCDGGIVRHPF